MNRAAWVIVAAACAGVYAARLDHVAGLVVDDAWYIVLAKALQSGAGFRLISSAAEPILPAVPPGFPAVLAAVWALLPRFPDNVLLLKSVSIAAMLGLAALSYAYIAIVLRERALAIVVAIATVLLPSFVFLATSTVMPECLFAAVQLAAVFALDRPSRADTPAARMVVVAALLTALAMLLRSAGVALAVAGVAILIHRRKRAHAMVFAAIIMLCMAPWIVYAQLNAPSPAQQRAHGGSISYSYSQLLSMREAGLADAGQATLADLPHRVWINSVDIFGRHVGALILPVVYRGANESGVEVFALGGTGARTGSMGVAAGTVVLSLALAAVMLAGVIANARQHGMHAATTLVIATFLMIVLVPSHSTFRYLLPLAPFMLLWFFTGVRTIAGSASHNEKLGAPVRVAAATIVLLFAIEHLQYSTQRWSGGEAVWLADYHGVNEVTAWMKQSLPPDGAVATTNPGLIYLLTGRRAVALDNASDNWDRWRQSGIRYAVATRVVEKPPAALGYKLRYESARQKLWVLELTSAPADSTKTGSGH